MPFRGAEKTVFKRGFCNFKFWLPGRLERRVGEGVGEGLERRVGEGLERRVGEGLGRGWLTMLRNPRLKKQKS